MKSLNRVQLIGNLGVDPKIIELPKGAKKATFSLATTRRIEFEGNFSEITQWHNIVCWQKLAEIVKDHLFKGMKILVEGEIQYRGFEGKYYTDIRANKIMFLSSKPHSKDLEEEKEDEIVENPLDHVKLV